MVQRFKLLFLFFLMLLFLPAFRCPAGKLTGPLCRVVTAVELSCSHESYLLQRHYTSQEKIGAVLTYLRLLSPRQQAHIDPEILAGERYCIRLHFSSGPDQVYYQHANRFLSANRSSWQAIGSATARVLHDLMTALPSDS